MASSSSSRTMRAVQYDRYGGGADGLKHVEVPIPSPKKGELLLRMEAASINRVDWNFQNGKARPVLPSKFPFIPVCELAGEVVELGAGVSGFSQGDKVIAVNFPGGGGLAEYAVVPASQAALRPAEVSAVEGACLPIAAFTALAALRTAGVGLDAGDGPPKNVLVTAASGGVGTFAVQLASLAGHHHVTATCGARNLDLVRSLGADEALDYGTPEGAALRGPSGRKHDAVVHCGEGFPWSAFEPALADAGGVVVDLTPRLASVAVAVLHWVFFSRKKLVPLIAAAKKEDMEALLGMVSQGKLQVVIDSRYPLSRAHEGWAKSMSGHATGKVVVDMGIADAIE
ncbi:chloroplast envelope quinone oxidoreductase homolog [Triticum dicoccoides]|uniref:chloroplast envelope quinone oxidoreductase homolog n=1 Tax=Triticum dicoccoides TaxID=85692 RepID=UPI00189023E9|nr:chloroplast envelope quinone oxidoreductase homolog [Triticum dicoccoides]